MKFVALAAVATLAIIGVAHGQQNVAGTGVPGAERINAEAVKFMLLDQVKWSTPLNAPNGNMIIAGDPTKSGFYAQLTIWRKGKIGRAHV